MKEIQFGRVVKEEPNEDGSTTITEEGFYKGERKSVKITIRQDIDTTRNSLLKDLITCLEELKTSTPDLTIIIKKDRYGNPFLIQKSWTTHSQHEKR